MEFSNKKNLLHRLSIIEGQIRGVKKMIDDDKACRDIVTQVTAARSALENTLSLILTENLRHCIKEQMSNEEDVDHAIKEAIEMITKSS